MSYISVLQQLFSFTNYLFISFQEMGENRRESAKVGLFSDVLDVTTSFTSLPTGFVNFDPGW